MNTALHEVGRACLPREALPVLAGLRAGAGVQITLDGAHAWVSWAAGDEEVLRRVLPVAGVAMYVHRDGLWHRFGRHLPAFNATSAGESRPLAGVLFPAPVQSLPVPALEPCPLALGLVPDDHPRPASAGIYALAALTAWAENVPSARLSVLRAARDADRVLLLGARLPPLPEGERFWGEQVRIPLGYRPDPALPESALREALGVAPEELILLKTAAGGLAVVEAIPRAAFQPLTRAGLRLALREGGA